MLDHIFRSSRHALYIAEIGMNHNGDPELAREHIRAAALSGADAVKFQTFVPSRMNSVYSDSLLEQGCEKAATKKHEDFFKQFVIPFDAYLELKVLCDDLGIVFFSSPFDDVSVTMLERLDVPLYKVASSELTNHILLKEIALTGKPVILSTGICDEKEISMALDIFDRHSSAEIVLMHCVSLYPLMPSDVNLKRIVTLSERFGKAVGFSDHTPDSKASAYASLLGSRVFEKHFTISSAHDCPDRAVSADPEVFSGMICDVEEAIEMTGTGKIKYGREESLTARAARRSLFAKRFIPEGKVLEEDDVVALRPGTGLPVYELENLIGKKSKNDIPANYIIKKESFI